ncbi:SWIM zinc finger family protein [Nonomuraea solani]|uniref:SWIM zinc finger family protein n=1 Tax=Nonomuraea solani TaxID=1144553 RepID=UPI001F4406EB|nr:SWIM zinc finger family protein [Nonomuraea solani]
MAPQVVAAAVEGLTSRLRKKLDAAVEQYAALPVEVVEGEGVRIQCGEDAVVTLSLGMITEEDQVRCSCLLAPRCLHRAAVLSACPVADPAAEEGTGQPPLADPAGTGHSPLPSGMGGGPAAGGVTPAGGGHAAAETGAQPAAEIGAQPAAGIGGRPAAADGEPHAPAGIGRTPTAGEGRAAPIAGGKPAAEAVGAASAQTEVVGPVAPSAAQVAAGAGLWAAGAAVLAAGVPAAGAVPQAELLRAAHTARLAGLPRAEAAAVRVVRGLRSARAAHGGHRLTDLVSALRELLLIAGRLAAADADPALIGTVRRNYEQGGSLRVYGVFREPVISATGYGGVVTHVVTADGRWFSVSDVRPGGSARARGAGTATIAIGTAMLSHAQLARAGLLIAGATVSPDGRLGAGSGVRATPVSGMPWTEGPMAALFARPLSDAARARLSGAAWSEDDTADEAREPVGCDLVIVGAAGDHVLARELTDGEDTDGPLIHLVPASRHPDLAHVANLQRLASRPGLRVRVVGRVEPDRAATLQPLAVGPVPDTEATLRLPDDWQGRADLGYDRLQGSHLPPPDAITPPGQGGQTDPLAGAPLWRVRRLVELAVAGGRRAVAESGRSGDFKSQEVSLRRSGFRSAADLSKTLTSEADRRERDVFGRLTDSGSDRYVRAWLAAATHLVATERALIKSSWQSPS